VVARPPLRLRIEPMRLDDIDAVHRIESASFPVPWPDYAFRQELLTNRLAHYLVVRVGDEAVAYGGIWLMVDEAHITTFAVLPDWRRRGIGGRLLLAVLELAERHGARVATLEVRVSNLAARMLYARFGFAPVGVRPRYYSDNAEDALIMTSAPLASAQMRQRLAALGEKLGDLALADEPSDGQPGKDDS
jgi:ribosomal-protein-alanine N-acetyltransferase